MHIRRPVRRQPGSILSRVVDRVRGALPGGPAGTPADGDPCGASCRCGDHGDTGHGSGAHAADRHHGAQAPGRTGRAPVPHLQVIRSQAGITTAEYAVGTAAGAGLAGLLYTMLTGGFGDQLLNTLFDHVLGLLGIG